MRVLALLAVFAAVEAVTLSSRAGAIGHYAKVIKVFEDMFVKRKVDLAAAEDALKDTNCKCDSTKKDQTTRWSEASARKTYWSGLKGANGPTGTGLMASAKSDVESAQTNLDSYGNTIKNKGDSCKSAQDTYNSNLQTMRKGLQQLGDAQSLVSQHLGSFSQGTFFLQESSDSVKEQKKKNFQSFADARIITPELRSLLQQQLAKESIRMQPDQLKLVMEFVSGDMEEVNKKFFQFMQAGAPDAAVDQSEATFEAVWEVIQNMRNQLQKDINDLVAMQAAHDSACKNLINIEQAKIEGMQEQFQMHAANLQMYTDRWTKASRNEADAAAEMGTLEGESNLGGCDGSEDWKTQCVTWNDQASNSAKETAMHTYFKNCNADGTSGTCAKCGWDTETATDGSLKNPQRCRMTSLKCARDIAVHNARIDVLNDELESLGKAKETMYQKEAEFDSAAKASNAFLFFLQESSKIEENYPPSIDHTKSLRPVIDKVDSLITNEKKRVLDNQLDLDECNDNIREQQKTFDEKMSLAKAKADSMDAYKEELKFIKDSVRELNQELEDVKTAISKLKISWDSESARVIAEIASMTPLISTVQQVQTDLTSVTDYSGNAAFTETDTVVVLVKRLISDLQHEQAQLTQEKTDRQNDYNAENKDLEDQETSLENRVSAHNANKLIVDGNHDSAETAHNTASSNAKTAEESLHGYQVTCNNLMGNFRKMQQDLEDHIEKLTKMLGLFQNLAGVSASHVSRFSNSTTYGTTQSPDRFGDKDYTGLGVGNHEPDYPTEAPSATTWFP